MNLADQTQQIIDGLDSGHPTKAELRVQAERLKGDLELSGAGLVEVVRDHDDQPPVVSNMTPDGAVG